MAFDPSGDFESVCTDMQKSVTARLSGVDCHVNKALITPYEVRELDPTAGQVLRNGTLFIWSKSRTAQPSIGDIVIDGDGTYWTVWRLTNAHHVQTWNVFALNLNIVTAAANTATILEGFPGKGLSNEAKVSWMGVVSGSEGGTAADKVTARFQPSEETSRVELNSEWAKDTYRVYFDPPPPVSLAGGNYRLVDADGNRYYVARYYDEGRIDRLSVAIAVKITEGFGYWNP